MTFHTMWKNMINRCYNPRHPRYHDWGGRGITVCEEWKSNPEKFKEWAKSRWDTGLQLDRRDNDKEYSPENCRFVTPKEQARNRRPRQLTELGKFAIREAVAASNRRRSGFKWLGNQNASRRDLQK